MNSDFKINDNGEVEVQIAPVGDFNGSDAEGNAVPERITKESLDALAEKLNASDQEILVDVDHSSVRRGLDRDTHAAGWLSRFFTTVKGLFGKMKLTKRGKELVENREFRFLSPVFQLGEDGTPTELHSVAFTNTPAFEGYISPIVNHSAVPGPAVQDQDKETINMEITKDELVQLIKDTVAGMEKAEETAEEKAEETAENACSEEKPKAEETAENACSEETKNEEPKAEEPKEEPKAEETEAPKEEPKAEETATEEPKEEPKEEVIKIEALNAAPAALADVSGKSDWMNLHGDAFWKYLAAHPEIKG